MNRLQRNLTGFTLALLALLPCVQAQSLAGTYGREIATGLLAVSFEERHGMLVGQIVMGGLSYPAVAQLDGDGAYGYGRVYLYMGGGVAYFEVSPAPDGVKLVLASLDPQTAQSMPSTATAFELQPLDPAALDGLPSGGLPPGSLPVLADLRYEAGERLTAPGAGVSFVVPAGHHAGYMPVYDLFGVKADGAPGYAQVEASSRLEPAEALRQLEARWAAGHLEVSAAGPAEVEGNATRMRYDVLSPEGEGTAYVVVVAPPMGNAIMIAGIGVRGAEAWVAELVETIVSTLLMDAPIDVEEVGIRHMLSGKRAIIGDGGSLDTLAPAELHLCADGTYRYATLGAPPAGPAFEHTGRWSVLGNLLGSDVLLERSDGGPDERLTVIGYGGALRIEGRSLELEEGARCG